MMLGLQTLGMESCTLGQTVARHDVAGRRFAYAAGGIRHARMPRNARSWKSFGVS